MSFKIGQKLIIFEGFRLFLLYFSIYTNIMKF